ncbi:MAG: MazG family protein [Candidatus Acetothermia bacterium]|jgi:tetrapyrrole methylase family protein/MazG family protein|nr:MazG family protein [Candidatus Acetothermia bacterium]MDH7504611.1 MazG family protein [Candidatus Acetothermia bacterium]
MREFERLVELVARLRGPAGCPWDRAQTHDSLKGMLLEEAYETIAAIESGDPEALEDELGDLLLHIVFQAQIAREAGEFDIEAVLEKLNEKLLRRHPHVFGGPEAKDAAEVRRRWEEIKDQEARKGALPPLPALIAARKAQEQSAYAGRGEVSGDGLRSLLGPGEPEEEIGKLLFRVVALARAVGVEPELALRRATERFLRGE